MVTCASDLDCDNGLPCDGAEFCEQGFCLVGTAVNCNDNVGCTTDVCSNDLGGECLHLPRDADFDGHADVGCVDDGGGPLGDDCDDLDSNRFPGNLEVCDVGGHDEDCDSATAGGVDIDNDGYVAARCCNGTVCGNDCDDLRAGVNPQAQELCDELDNNCNGVTDEGLRVTVYQDLDGDQHGNPAVPLQQCAQAAHASLLNDDCDDNDIAVHPAQVEICDGKNNDCDGAVDENTPQVTTWWPDADGDRFGDPNGATIQSCVVPAGYALNDRDCNDSAPAISPVAPELCDSVDNDCNGLEDFRISDGNFEDDDNDGLVDGQCVGGLDCDDAAAETGPGSLELCDGRDNDCDLNIDEHASNSLWFRDSDGDGIGSTLSGVKVSCENQPGYSQNGGDCDDADPTVYPGQFEICDGGDQDCDGVADNDIDFNAPEHCGTCTNNCAQVPHSNDSCANGRCVCDTNFSDCNGVRGDGCEADLQNSWLNCGACGNACAVAHGAAECVAGSCEVVACVPSWDDCDFSGANGCETATNLLARCGDCDTNCNTDVVNVANRTCNNGECSYNGGCIPTFGDCDNNRANGCEAGLQTASNCGACGMNCPQLPNTSGLCGIGGLCDCQTNFGNCDSNNQNGCETNFRSPLSCGDSCGGPLVNCTGPNLHGTATCPSGTCQVSCDNGWKNCGGGIDCETLLGTVNNCSSCADSCNSPSGPGNGVPLCVQQTAASYSCATLCGFGWQNCDAEPRNCETHVSEDEFNCGGCGVVCAGGETCNAGVCGVQGSAPPAGGNFLATQVAVGSDFTCALSTDGNVYCWGNNSHGQLGNNSVSTHVVPTQVDRTEVNGTIVGVYAGGQHACLVAELSGKRQLYCWGRNGESQLAKPSSSGNQLRPSMVSAVLVSATVAVPVALGTSHSCVVQSDQEMYCWGDNSSGQLGREELSPNDWIVEVASQTSSSWLTPVAGANFTCGVDQAADAFMHGFCWGSNHSAQLTTATIPLEGFASLPEPLPESLSTILEFAAGEEHVCVRSGASVFCWGKNDWAQTLPSTIGTNPVLAPSQLAVPGSAKQIRAFAHHTCYLNTDGVAYCWGRNHRGQLGRNTTSPDIGSMAQLDIASTINGFANSNPTAQHSCAIDTNQRLWCWGDNSFGQTSRTASEPTQPTPFLVQL